MIHIEKRAGLKLIYQRSPGELIGGSLRLPSGTLRETDARAGITHLTSETVFKGSRRFSARRMAEGIEATGGQIWASASSDVTEVGFSVLRSRLRQLIPYLQELLCAPTFPEGEVDKERNVALADLQSRHDEPFDFAYDTACAALFKHHPLGRPVEGSASSLRRLRSADLTEWHRRTWRPEGAILSVSGDLPSAELGRLFNPLLSAWKSVPRRHAPKRWRDPAPLRRSIQTRRERPFQQAMLLRGYPLGHVQRFPFAAWKVFNAHLGGGMNSRLFQTLRETQGLCYDTGSLLPLQRSRGTLWLYAALDPRHLRRAGEETLRILRDIASRGLSRESLQDTRAYVRGNFELDHQTNYRRAWYLAWWEQTGRGTAFDAAYPAEISRVTNGAIRGIARQILRVPFVEVRVTPK